jgi:hypothetical protein
MTIVSATFHTLVALGLLDASPTRPAQPEPPPEVTLELQVGVHGTLTADALELARITAQALLATAGIRVDWQNCSSREGCERDVTGLAPILVQLLPVRKASDPAICGEAARDGRTGIRTVLVYVPPHADLMRGFQKHRHPALTTLRTGHLVGLTIAHEVGHGLGLAHSESGVMKARSAVEEVLALRTSRLAFQAAQGTRMRQAMLTSAETQLTDVR